MAVITLDEVKTLLQIAGTEKDALITMLIPIVESDIRAYCNANFQDSPSVPSWEPWMKFPASQMIGYQLSGASGNGMKSESQGGYSYTRADISGGYPIGIMHQFDKAKIAMTGTANVKANYRDMRGMAEGGIIAWPFVEDSYNADQAK